MMKHIICGATIRAQLGIGTGLDLVGSAFWRRTTHCGQQQNATPHFPEVGELFPWPCKNLHELSTTTAVDLHTFSLFLTMPDDHQIVGGYRQI